MSNDIKLSDVIAMLRPNGGWIGFGQDFSATKFIDCEPITEEELSAGFAQYDAWKAEQEAAKAAEKQALLNRLGITEAEAQLLLS